MSAPCNHSTNNYIAWTMPDTVVTTGDTDSEFTTKWKRLTYKLLTVSTMRENHKGEVHKVHGAQERKGRRKVRSEIISSLDLLNIYYLFNEHIFFPLCTYTFPPLHLLFLLKIKLLRIGLCLHGQCQ